ncbi:MAG TPA: hypothetical protein VKF42_07620 [Chitinivibrionales bacterium]|nr:hypothetical protein [Chitinivibrionales bacterium]
MKPLFFRLSICVACALAVAGCLSRQTMGKGENPVKKSESARASGGLGDSYETAVKITGGKDYTEAVNAEDGFISSSWGIKDKDWRLVEKTTVVDSGRTYDMVQVEIPKVGEKHFYYFDITRYKKKQKSSATSDESESAEPPVQKRAPATAAPAKEPKQTAPPPDKQEQSVPQAQQPPQPAAPAQQPGQPADSAAGPATR